MGFKKWLLEVGGTGGLGSGISPPLLSGTTEQGAFADYYGKEDTNPQNQNGKLPPIAAKKTKSKRYIKR